MKILAGVAVGVVTGYLLGLQPWQRPDSDYTRLRAALVGSNLELASPADTLVLGDSISEAINFENSCGKTFNAAVSGAKIADVARLVPLALEPLRPRTIILSVGTNHFWGSPALTSEFKADYLALAHSLPGRKILVGIPNSAPASAFVSQVARSIGATYVSPVSGNLTNDGVHPSVRGARIYRSRIAAACA